MLRASGQVITTRVRAGVMPRGVIPYDDLTLPITSPDGRFIATQTGVSPTWPTILAEYEAVPPLASRIEVYKLGEKEAEFHASAGDMMLLGRNADARGFLVEAPQDDGSRWIGHIAWETGDLIWLVQDEYVNAFAVLGPDGRLAWCRRATDEERFDLVVRHRDREWSVPAGTESWLMPVWSGTRSGSAGLFAFALRSGYLDAVYLPTLDGNNIRQTMRRVTVGENVTVFSAYQAVSAQTSSAMSAGEELVFFHPAAWQMAVWRPLAARGLTFIPGERSFSAVVAALDGSASTRFVLVCTEKNLTVQNLSNPRDRADLLAGMLLPRATSSVEWPYLLLSPKEGYIGLTSLTLLPPEEHAAAR